MQHTPQARLAEAGWALAADGQRARILGRRAPAGPWHERAADRIGTRDPPSREPGSGRPGRVQESAGTLRHAIEPRSDPHRAATQAFARQPAARLEDPAERFDRLVPVAPPAFPGDLRAARGEAARRRPRGTLGKGLTRAAPGGRLDAIRRG